MNAAEQLLGMFGSLPPEKQVEALEQTRQILGHRRWVPQEGPQTEAYFSLADELLYGGSAGGGKTDLLVGLALNEHHNSVIFRNGLKNVADLEKRTGQIVGSMEDISTTKHIADIGDGKSVEFASLDLPGSEEDWQGRRRDLHAFDEAAQQLKSRVQFVLGWNGSAVPGTRARAIFATNPPLSAEGNWLITWFAPWIDPMFPNPAKAGELRWCVNDKEGDPIWVPGPGRYKTKEGKVSSARSRTFIPSSLQDNRYLRDTDYRSRVEALPEPMRSALLEGNFMAAREDGANQLVPTEWVRLAQIRWQKAHKNHRMMVSLGVDVAQGGPDKTCLAPLMTDNFFDEPIVELGINTKDGPAVASLVVKNQRNGAPIGIDMTGGWGGDAATQLRQSEVDVVGIVNSEASGAADPDTGIFYYNLRAEMQWEMRRALNPTSGENICLPPGQKIMAEACAAKWFLKGGKILVQKKEEIKKELGSSPDIWDAIVNAWHIRGRGLAKVAHQGKARPAWANSMPEADPHAIDGVG